MVEPHRANRSHPPAAPEHAPGAAEWDASALPPAETTAYNRHDLRNVAWAYLESIRRSGEHLKLAAPAASMMRVILAMGEEADDREAAIAETAVIGGILHGIAPRDAAQWAIAEKHFDDRTLADLRHWTPKSGRFGQPPGEEFCACGCRWRTGDEP